MFFFKYSINLTCLFPTRKIRGFRIVSKSCYQRQTDTERDRQTDRETERQTETQTEGLGGQGNNYKNTHTNMCMAPLAEIEIVEHRAIN